MIDNELKNLGEFGLIRRIQQQVADAEHLVKGIGDDCAIQMQREAWQLLTSTDLLIEGVHFNRRWTSMEQLGRKSAAVNISDIAAMGGLPKSLFLGVAAPADIPVTELEAFSLGFISEAKRYGAVLAGGDTCRSPGPMMISVTVQGEIETGKAVCRNGARPGDAIYVSGTLGNSALALQMLLADERPSAELLRHHHQPAARVELGRQLAGQQLASAMLDVSDGLISDLGHILTASTCGAEIQLEALPLSEEFRLALALEPELIDLALAGGEDYELLFTSADQTLEQHTDLSPTVTRIGQISTDRDLRIRQPDNSLYHCSRGGFDHFS
jgi:thiamine-monophosphate kinase